MLIRRRLVVALLFIFVSTMGFSVRIAEATVYDGEVWDGRQTVEEKFLEKVQQLETYLDNGQYVEARLLVLQLQQLFPQLTFAGRTGVEGMAAISETFVHLKQLLSSVELQPEAIRHVGRQFALAVDALIHQDSRKQSRWKIRLEELLAELNDVRQAENAPPTPLIVQRLQQGYEELRPALSVLEPAAVIGQLDALHQRLTQLKLRRHVAAEEWSDVLGQLAELYQQILRGKDRPTLVEPLRAPFSRLTLGLLAFLVLALSYTAWCYRTFRGAGST